MTRLRQCGLSLAALMFMGSACRSQNADGINSHGTLAVFVPTDSGLVVCTDQREWNPIRGASDTERKIYVIGPKAAFTISGAVAKLDPITLRPLFSVKDLAIKHFNDQKEQPLLDKIRSLPDELNDAYLVFRRRGGSKLESSPGATDDVIYSLTVWYASEGRVSVGQIQLHNGPECSGLACYQDMTEQFSRKMHLDGQTEFIMAAIRNSDPRFAMFKADPDIKKVWTAENPNTVSPDLAVRFGRKVILFTNKFHHLVSTTPTLVSAESDCSLMSKSRGFEWLEP